MQRATEPDTAGRAPAAANTAAVEAGSRADHAATPRYRAIYEELALGIRTGRFPVMSLLPTEHQLRDQYGVSRHTVREAIRMLAECGMVSRRRGIGTRVEADTPATRYTQQISQMSDLFQYIANATLQVCSLSMLKVSRPLAKVLGCKPGTDWLCLNAIKLLGGHDTPVAFAAAYIHPDYSAIRPDIGKARLPLSQLIEERYNHQIHEVNQVFSATPIKGAAAKALNVAEGTAGLVITRRYYGQRDRLMLVTITTFPHKKMKYSMSLKLG